VGPRARCRCSGGSPRPCGRDGKRAALVRRDRRWRRPAPRRRARRRQLLLLDDEEAILLPTAKYFRSLGWTVDLAREAEEGEALISHRHYDLAILDVRVTRFGGTGGLELLREIRRRDHGTSVIVLSAYMSTDMEAEAALLGAAAVLRKPQSLARSRPPRPHRHGGAPWVTQGVMKE
jgi:CheY-like chemotaxis protein